MMSFLLDSMYFGLVLTLLIYVAAVFVNKKWNYAVTTPLLLTCAGVIGFLVLFGIPYDAYEVSARYLVYFLVPATVCFAIPMYRQIKFLGKYKWVVLVSVFVGCAVSVLSVVTLCWAFGLIPVIARSLASVSVTTAIAVGITKELGGIIGLTVFAVIITGILGNAIGRQACAILGLKTAAAKGLAIGNSSHAMGTVKALEMGEAEGAFASIAIVISGIMTAALAPLILYLFS
ncbi:MAG: LrgB family protein [Alphaproteobacteria bacterium]|nr:LrgB family protein [Alphaproteobacteria bacterium]